MLVHELCHCITDTTKELAYNVIGQCQHVPYRMYRSADETVVSWIATIVYKMSQMKEPGNDPKNPSVHTDLSGNVGTGS